jgi:hypothetical protein
VGYQARAWRYQYPKNKPATADSRPRDCAMRLASACRLDEWLTRGDMLISVEWHRDYAIATA